MKYRKKPVVIEAFQWGVDEVPKWWIDKSAEFKLDINSGSVFIPTLEGTHEARVNDFIIKGIKGELYPCKPDIFEATYEAVIQ
ncbi:MAG: hypothetical protein U9O94_02930 [Nanoarchaeota archaeon]|nr:hypothetical protein [Nanoarchaeota archaeon]